MHIEKHKRHGGAYDRGSADRYYGRPYSPHYYTVDTLRVEAESMTEEEVEAYKLGWEEETDRKQYD